MKLERTSFALEETYVQVFKLLGRKFKKGSDLGWGLQSSQKVVQNKKWEEYVICKCFIF